MEPGTRHRSRAAFVAHTPATADGLWHGLRDHLDATSGLAAEFGAAFGAGEIGRLAGRWHDLGKYDQSWQSYLRAQVSADGYGGRPPDHRRAGILRAFGAKLSAVAFAIAGHHGGMPSLTDLKGLVADANSAGAPAMEQVLTSADDEGAPGLQDGRAVASKQPSEPLLFEMFTRLLFSALVDADFLDTESHLTPANTSSRVRPTGPDAPADLLARLVRWRVARTVMPSPIQDWRERWRSEAVGNATCAPGFFRLALPTGAGKTLTGLEFALAHAVAHGLRRVVMSVPFLTVTEQVAQVYREVLGDPGDAGIVLEQHSGAFASVEDDDDAIDMPARWARLAAENWDAPVVVTTSVSLFESLMGNRPGRSRRVHRLAGSVIVIDEVQALPVSLMEPLVRALHDLVMVGGCSVVLCSATQPTFEEIPSLRGFRLTNLAPSASPAPAPFRRVRQDWRLDGRSSWLEVAGWLRDAPQGMVIVNTRRHAHELLDALADPDACHLSTLMCGTHRREVLDRVRSDLRAGRPCRLVATQVVEAGVDVDFPFVARALAPWDAIVQAAGRCNREGRLGHGAFRIFIPPDDASPLGAYLTGIGVTRQLPGRDLDDPDASAEYYRRLFANVDTDAHRVGDARKALDFPDVARKVRLVDDDGVPAIVTTHGDAVTRARVQNLLRRLEDQPERTRVLWRELSPFVVNVGVRAADEARRRGWLEPVTRAPGAAEIWLGRYDATRGLVMADLAPRDLIV